MLSGIEYGSVIESSTHMTIRDGRQAALARNVIIVEFDDYAATQAATIGDLVWWQELRNPHLVEIIGAARTDNGLTLVLDQAACVTVRSVTALGRPAQALLVCQTLDALAVIHDAAHAHGNVGIDAVLVDTNGLARLALPGLAASATAFHAPELNGSRRTPHGDLYSAGRLLEHLAGPDAGRLAPIISLATAATPAARYPSAQLMRQAIDAVMTDEEGRDWISVAFSGLAAATATVIVAGTATSSAGAASSSITIAGITSNTVPPPPPPPPPPPVHASPASAAHAITPPPPPSPTALPAGPGPLVPLRVGGLLRHTRRSRILAGSAATIAVTAAVITGLVISSGGNNTPAAAPTTIPVPGSSIQSSPPAPPTTAAATATTVAPPAVPAAFDALPAPITATPATWMWSGPVGTVLAADTVTGDGTVIAVITDANGAATAVGIRDGTEIWRHPLPVRPDKQLQPFSPTIIADGDTAIVAYDLEGAQADQGPSDLGLTSLNASDGTERWSQRIENASPIGLQHGPGHIVIINAVLVDDSQTAAIDATDGHFLWNRDTAQIIGSPTAIRADRVVISYWRDNETDVVDMSTGQRLIKVDGQDSALAEPVLYTMTGDFACDPKCILQGNDATSGTTLWQAPDQTGYLLGVTADGDALLATTDAAGADQVGAVDATGTPRWTTPGCADSIELTSLDAGTLIYCPNGLTLHDNGTGTTTQQIPYDANSANALAADRTLYTVVQQHVTAIALGANIGALWSVDLPAGFTPTSAADTPFFFSPAFSHVANAFDHRLVIRGHVAGGGPALAMLTDLAFTPPVQPVQTLTEITGGANVAGHVGPYTMPDGTSVLVVAHGDPTALSDTPADVELAVERADGWHIVQTIEFGSVGVPVEVGDVTGDGRTEIDIPSPTPIGGKSTETLYRIDDNGPTLIAIPFVIDGQGPGAETNALHITAVSVDHVTALVNLCNPTCELAPATTMTFVLDRTGTWSLRATQPLPPPVVRPTVCIRSNIDFAALRAAPDLAAGLLAQIPPGTCGVILADTTTVQGNGFAWYHVQWNGIDGWTAKSNTA